MFIPKDPCSYAIIFLRREDGELGILVCACDPSTHEAKAVRSQVQSQTKLHHEFQANLGYKVRACTRRNRGRRGKEKVPWDYLPRLRNEGGQIR